MRYEEEQIRKLQKQSKFEESQIIFIEKNIRRIVKKLHYENIRINSIRKYISNIDIKISKVGSVCWKEARRIKLIE